MRLKHVTYELRLVVPAMPYASYNYRTARPMQDLRRRLLVWPMILHRGYAKVLRLHGRLADLKLPKDRHLVGLVCVLRIEDDERRTQGPLEESKM